MKKGLLRISTLLLALLVLIPVPALAEHGRHDRGKHSNRGGLHRGEYKRQPVPMVLYASQRTAFRPYYRGEVYYRPHHHYHLAYRLPVYVDGVVVYRPYYYCGDRLFVSAAVPVPRLAIHIDF